MKTKKLPSPPAPVAPPTEAQIANRAHELWLLEGCPENRSLAHWVEAERQLGARPALHDDASRLSANPMDPASSDAAEIDEELENIVQPPGSRSATSL